MTPDLAAVAAEFGAMLRAAGLPVGPDRCARFARAVTVVRPATVDRLRWCARATLAAGPDQLEVLDRVFDAVFDGWFDSASDRGDPRNRTTVPEDPGRPAPGGAGAPSTTGGRPSAGGAADPGASTVEGPSVATAVERLAGRDFADLSPAELATLVDAMRRLRIATPPRRSRRTVRVPHGTRVDLRSTLRLGRRTGGDPATLVHRRPREKPRRLVVLCDISGSMEPYGRAMLQLLYCAAGAARAEVFTFATRLTRLTRVFAGNAPAAALEKAGRAAPDWSGGTRIAAAVKDFVDRHGRRGPARGAVVLIVSDGWETGPPEALAHELERLSRLAYRIVWANPRTQSPRYRPLVGGMAAAWPYCDAVVSAHSLTALDDLLAALADTRR
ncbi:vWA domain-containing protein [Virgisporangium ochraceum]|uniref:VWA containing CoxE family protein n=1 Tax=Virgisporangium ochraceum TaxID=65505 RepID=A0A8J3ZX45_9ACTN|nr:VWA domain-containing protein [Virgisporangium ochraceum]GIJ69110.1 hypothetical protein Voc01_040270 [Virgisporangium ochraceum]